MMKKILLAFSLLVVGLLTVLLVRTAGFASRQLAVVPADAAAIDAAAAAERLAGALRLPTVSLAGGAPADTAAFAALHAHLAASFPLVHGSLDLERVNGYSLLYTWAGSEPALAPALLMGHLDVVPVEPGSEDAWTHLPFAGQIADGYVWGRGALDNKGGVLAILEAIELLLAEGFRPRRTLLLAFGHDEEVGGEEGARAIAARLADRGVRLDYVLDEGGAIMAPGLLPGLDAPVALVGTAEKGYVSLQLSVAQEGGHSSMPPRQSAVGILSTAIHRLQARPFPGGLRGPAREMFAYLGPELPFAQRLVFANTWLFRPLIESRLAREPSTDAMLRTTTAPTMFSGSVKDNVLPTRAQAVVNFRILPGETVASVRERVRRTIDDPRVEIAVLDGFGTDPSPVSPTDAPAFTALHRTIREVAPDVLVAPYLIVGATDARHYAGLSENVYRFLPVRFRAGDLARMHGIDERVAVDDHVAAIRFYRQLIRNTAG